MHEAQVANFVYWLTRKYSTENIQEMSLLSTYSLRRLQSMIWICAVRPDATVFFCFE
jgi:hypothetical protein